MNLYAHLHGLARGVSKSHHTEIEESDLDKSIVAYAELLVHEEKKSFQEGLESFTTHANRIRQQVRDAMHEFYQRYDSGYRAICEVLEAEALEKPQVAEENLAIFEDLEAFVMAMESGVTISELLGFSHEEMTRFYTALQSLFEKEEFEKMRDGFFFLITISPETPEYWTGLGIAETKLKSYDKAKEAYLQALELDPASKDAYLGCLHVYVMTNAQGDAEKLCDKGIGYAQSNPNVPWAQELEALLFEAKSVLKADV